MVFGSPQYLWFLGTLAIPIFIHLFRFRKIKKVVFPMTFLIEEVQKQNARLYNLKHILVMLARMLALLFLVIAFADPKPNSLASISRFIFFIDNSPSMSALVGGNENALDETINAIGSVIKNLERTAEVAVLTPTPYASPLKFMQREAALEELRRIRIGPTSSSWSYLHEYVGDHTPYQLYVGSDFQKTSGDLSYFDSLAQKGNITLIPVVALTKSNVFIDTVFTPQGYLLPGQPLKINVVFKQSDNQPRSFTFTIVSEEKLYVSQSVDMESTSKEVSIDLPSIIASANQSFQIKLQDFPVVFDNTFYFTLVPFPKPKVVVIFETKMNTYLKAILTNSSFFECIEMTSADVDYAALENADILILDGVLSPMQDWIARTEAQKILVFPILGSETILTQISNINLTLSSAEEFIGTQSNQELNYWLSQAVTAEVVSADMPEIKPLFTISGADKVLLSSVFGDPVWASKIYQNKEWFVLASPLEVQFTNLPEHAIFLPLFYRICLATQTTGKMYYSVTNPSLELPLGKERELAYQVISDKISFKPDTKWLGNGLRLDLPPDIDAGQYFVVNEIDTVGSFSLNIDKLESEMEFYTEAQLSMLADKNENITIVNSQSAQYTEFNETSTTAWWKYALLLALMFLLIEQLLIRFIK